MAKKKINKNELKEPVVPYKKELKLEFYNSYDEMNEAQINEMANLSYKERLKFAVELSLRAYGVTREDLNKRMRNQITLDIRNDKFID